MNKNHPLLISLLLLFSICPKKTFSQELDLCKGYNKLVKESANTFAGIMVTPFEAEHSNSRKLIGGTRTLSSFMLKGASECYINEMDITGIVDFYAGYEEFETEEEAAKRQERLKTEFKECKPAVEIIEDTVHYLGSLVNHHQYFVKENITGGFLVYKMKMGITINKKGKYVPFISLPAHAAPVAYVNIPRAADTTLFGRELRRIVVESQTAFKNIMGEEIGVVNFKTMYASSFCVARASCMIVKDLIFKSCRLLFAGKIPAEQADKWIKGLIPMLASALGNQYALTILEDGVSYGFSEISKITDSYTPLIVLNKEKNDTGIFSVTVTIKEPGKAF